MSQWASCMATSRPQIHATGLAGLRGSRGVNVAVISSIREFEPASELERRIAAALSTHLARSRLIVRRELRACAFLTSSRSSFNSRSWAIRLDAALASRKRRSSSKYLRRDEFM